MRRGRLACILICATVLAGPAFAQDPIPQPPAEQAQAPVRLFGGLSHSEDLPHVDQSLQPHRTRGGVSANQPVSAPAIPAQALPPEAVPQDEIPPAVPLQQGPPQQSERPQQPTRQLQANATQQRYVVEWFIIPPWMAGNWYKDGDLTTRVTNLRTGASSAVSEWTPNKLSERWGHQMDQQGNFWHANLLPSEQDGTSDNKKVRFVAVAQRCEKSTPSELLTRTHYVVSESDIWTGQAVDMFQQESLNHYVLSGQSELTNTSSNRVFTYQGRPERDGQLLSKFRKTGNFLPVEVMNGINLRDSLRDYLSSSAH
jgi:hypothetical protein